MKKLYIGCAINNLPLAEKEKFPAKIENIKSVLRNYFEVLDFLGTAAGSPRDIYQQDIVECVEKADCMLAICDHPSTGLGYEMAMCIEKRGIPVVAMAHHDSSVSRLIIGIPSEKYHFIRYDSVEEIPEQFLEVMMSTGVLA